MMETLIPLVSVAGFEFTLINIVTVLFIATLALCAGALPGIGPAISIVLLIPFINYFDTATALVLLGVIYICGTYGGSVTAILMNIPGTGASAATLLDGYPMSKKGQAITAIAISTTSSILGGLIALLVVYLATPILSDIVLLFASPENLLMIVFGLLIIALVSKGNMLKGIVSGTFGLMIMSIGLLPHTGELRYTLGMAYLYDGIQFLTVLVGVFAVTEMISLAGQRSQISMYENLEGSPIKGIKQTLSRYTVVIRSSLVGFFVGTIPGAGGAIANFVAYGISSSLPVPADFPPFGEGNIDGVISSESSNNAVVSGALVPTLTFGIPGSATTAVIIGALNFVGLNPGPQLFGENVEAVYTIYFGVLLGCLYLLIMYWAGPLVARVTITDRSLLIPSVLVASTLGIYSLRTNMGDVFVMYVFGLIGYVMVKYDYEIIALVLGVILGTQAETMLLRTIQLGGLSLAAERPLFAMLLVANALVVIFAFTPLPTLVKQKVTSVR